MIRVLVLLLLLLLLMSCAPTTPPPPESLVTLNLTNWAWDVVRVELQCRSNGRRLVVFPIVDKGTKASRRFNPRACDQAIPVVFYRGRRDRPVSLTQHWIAIAPGMSICIAIAELLSTSTVVDCTRQA